MERSVRILHSGGDFNDVCTPFRYPATHVRTTSHNQSTQQHNRSTEGVIPSPNRIFKDSHNNHSPKHKNQPHHSNNNHGNNSQHQNNNHLHGAAYVVHPFYNQAQRNIPDQRIQFYDTPTNQQFPTLNSPYEPISPISGTRLQSSAPQAYFQNFPALNSGTTTAFCSPGSETPNNIVDQFEKINVSDSPTMKKSAWLAIKPEVFDSSRSDTSNTSIAYNVIVKGAKQDRNRSQTQAVDDDKEIRFGTHRRSQSSNSQRGNSNGL